MKCTYVDDGLPPFMLTDCLEAKNSTCDDILPADVSWQYNSPLKRPSSEEDFEDLGNWRILGSLRG